MSLNTIKNEAEHIRMSAADKSAMRAALMRVILPAPAASPYFVFSYQFLHTRVLAPLLVVLVVFVGGGTAVVAAQGALPGDLLYPVKISVNEEVETALAQSPVAKAQVHTALAQRRVEEAETLAQKGELTATTTAALTANFEEHAASAQAITSDVAADDPSAGAELQLNLDSTLAVHGAILAALGEDSTDAQTQEGSSDLSGKVLARAGSSARAASAKVAAALQDTDADQIGTTSEPEVQTVSISVSVATGSSTATTTATTTVVAEPDLRTQKILSAQLGEGALNALTTARQSLKGVQNRLDATTSAQVAEQIGDIDALINSGNESLKAGEPAGASASFAQALELSLKLSIMLDAQKRLDKNIVSPLLDAAGL